MYLVVTFQLQKLYENKMNKRTKKIKYEKRNNVIEPKTEWMNAQ